MTKKVVDLIKEDSAAKEDMLTKARELLIGIESGEVVSFLIVSKDRDGKVLSTSSMIKNVFELIGWLNMMIFDLLDK